MEKQTTNELIKTMRNQGKSYSEITRELNAKGLKNTQGKKFKVATVYHMATRSTKKPKTLKTTFKLGPTTEREEETPNLISFLRESLTHTIRFLDTAALSDSTKLEMTSFTLAGIVSTLSSNENKQIRKQEN